MSKIFPNLNRKENKSNLDIVVSKPLFHSIDYQLSNIVKMIENIDNLDQDQIRNIIIRQHSMILNYDLFLQDPKTRSEAIRLFTNKTFLNIFLSVVRILNLTHHEIICINKLSYDYYVLPDKDTEISDLLYMITAEVNTNQVLVLSGVVGLSMAKIISMIRNSTFIESKAVQRINKFIIKSYPYISYQDIVSIYNILFPDNISTVIIYTMIETKEDTLTEEQNRKFDNISIAILTILDNLTSAEIKRVLCDYSFTIYKTNIKKVRFSLKGDNYPRITKAIRELEISDGIIIP